MKKLLASLWLLALFSGIYLIDKNAGLFFFGMVVVIIVTMVTVHCIMTLLIGD